MLKFNFNGQTDDLTAGINELCGDYDFAVDKGGIPVSVRKCEADRIYVDFDGKSAEIGYSKKVHFFRALGLLIENLRSSDKPFSLSETSHFDMNGPMFDVSQGNAVINIKTAKGFLRRLAIMGMDMLMMYCEDSFDVDGHPYFGYMRARYSKDDIRELDAYALIFGIELIPCIQTLAHFAEVLKWREYRGIAEDDECLLVGEEKTYEFVEVLLREATEPFSTKRIHIGMDEAWKLGRGKYLTKNGYVPPIEIMKIHLERVMEIVRKLGLKPMMWSDMFFRSLAGGDYYSGITLPKSAIEMVPDDLQTVYWDYYNHSPELYEKMIIEHKRFKSEPVFAGGVWTWNGFGPNWEITFEMTRRALTACKKHNIRQIIATIWGDDGTECPADLTLFGLSLFAEAQFCDGFDFEKFKRRFAFCCRADYDDFYALEAFNRIPSYCDTPYNASNPSKYLLWQDVLCGLFDKNIEGVPLKEHYSELADKLKGADKRNPDFALTFNMFKALAEALSEKGELGLKLTAAYKSHDLTLLRLLADNDIPLAAQKISALRQAHFEVWKQIYKMPGWNVMDIRYGAILARLDTAQKEVQMYLSGELDELSELDEQRLSFNEYYPGEIYCNHFTKIISPSRL